MKVIICQGGVKRQIDGPFWICLSADDRDTLVKRLQEAGDRGVAYGWIAVRDELPLDIAPNTEPLPWIEPR